MITAFKNKDVANHFILNGYTVFSFLNEHQLSLVRKIYHQANQSQRLNKEQFYGVNYSLGTLSAGENERIMKPVEEVIQTALNQHFFEYEVLGYVFITKPPHTKTTFVYHQDWSYTYEKLHAFATCWIPLYDTNKSNGCMSILPGTHLTFDTYRSDSLDSARIEFEDIPNEIRVDIEQQAGTCLSFHQAAFHGSYPNVSDNSRPVLGFVVKHKQSPIMHYVNEGAQIAGYRLSVSEFNSMLTQIPKSPLPNSAVKEFVTENKKTLPTASDIIAAYRTVQCSHKLIKDIAQHSSFQKDGFLVLRDALPMENVEALSNFYKENFKTQEGMYVTHHAERNSSRNKEFSNKIFELTKEFMTARFEAFKPLIAHFAAKAPGSKGLFNLHQDWSIVREELYGVLHCWIPLQDTSRENGTLAVLPKSHLCFQNYRSGSCSIRFLPFESLEDKILHLNVRKGDVVLYHPALFHGSAANETKQDRLAVVAAIAHIEAQQTYHSKEGNEIWTYEMTDDDLFGRLDDLAKGGKPFGKKIQKVQYRALNITDEEMIVSLRNFCSKNINEHAEV